jgi:hypothetical protein
MPWQWESLASRFAATSSAPASWISQMNALTINAVNRRIADNPYAGYMSASLAERCEEIQREQVSGHWTSLKAELAIARVTLGDMVQFYAAMHQLPPSQSGREAAILDAGRLLRDAIEAVGAIAMKAAKVESEMRDKHDPTVTLQFIRQAVLVIDERLREAEERGELRDAEGLIREITMGVDEQVRLPLDSPFTLNNTSTSVGTTPSSLVEEQVRAMIDTVPAAG